jgi:hypothetical protein
MASRAQGITDLIYFASRDEIMIRAQKRVSFFDMTSILKSRLHRKDPSNCGRGGRITCPLFFSTTYPKRLCDDWDLYPIKWERRRFYLEMCETFSFGVELSILSFFPIPVTSIRSMCSVI